MTQRRGTNNPRWQKNVVNIFNSFNTFRNEVPSFPEKK
jgi:hypothetical protein